MLHDTSTNKLDREKVINQITKVEYYHYNNKVTICFITVKGLNYVITGQSGVIDPNGFNKELGETFSYEDALRNLYKLASFKAAYDIHNDLANKSNND